jgi:UDPglucose 6-dehydrogenase
MRMVVLGTGYLGATHAACMADLGHEVLGVDVDPAKIAKLEAGEVPFFEPGLAEVLHRTISSGRLRFSSSYQEAAGFAEVFFVAVATPQKKGDYGADFHNIGAVA